MKEKFWYFGYVVALLLILLIAFTDFPSGADMALAILFTCVFSVTHTQLLHRRMLHTDSSNAAGHCYADIYYFKLYGFCHNCRSNYPDTAIGPNHCKQYH